MLLPMVITSNLSLAELEAATGDARIPSRISRMCKVLEVGND
jgi:DNA replication protein DnaC